MLEESYPYYLANKPYRANRDIKVVDKYSGELVSFVASASLDTINEAIQKASEVFKSQRLAAYKREEILEHCVSRFKERFDELAYVICVEVGKPIQDARGEVTRLIDTFRIAAAESTRMRGEVLTMDTTKRADGYSGMWKRFPIGVCSFISPFNFPLNLVAHKVAPAIAVGNPFVLKPATSTPIAALIIGEILAETDLPEGYFSILPCSREVASPLVEDERIKLLSFTGSKEAGWSLRARAGKKKVVLELGGNAGCIVDEGSNISDVVSRVIFGAFYQSGQSCISVQRLFVHKSIYSEFKEKLVKAANALVKGDPKKENTFIGPMISESEAIRLDKWIGDAKAKGANVLCGGTRDGAIFDATVLENVPKSATICSMEAFGPVVIISSFESFSDAIKSVNDTSYGLQAGVFTNDINKILRSWEELEVGGVLINEIPSWRADHMPYGGVKDSGNTREGIRYSMEEMSEMKLLAIRTIP